jgi:hypothetical protein
MSFYYDRQQPELLFDGCYSIRHPAGTSRGQPDGKKGGKDMENRKNCKRCQGRMFLEFDYIDQRYDYTCISCGHAEPSIPVNLNPPNNLSNLNGKPLRKVRGYARA